ncbi:hypothetical protein J6590_087820 [Homalodisca vitripennis]|nr:hypothetical protein J6590_087820 [Homalodisca vitripennis]
MGDTSAEVDEEEISERLVDLNVLQQASTSKLANKGLKRDGHVLTTPTYTPVWAPFKVLKPGNIQLKEVAANEDVKPLKSMKIKDLKDMQQFKSKEGCQWFDDNVFNY